MEGFSLVLMSDITGSMEVSLPRLGVIGSQVSKENHRITVMIVCFKLLIGGTCESARYQNTD